MLLEHSAILLICIKQFLVFFESGRFTHDLLYILYRADMTFIQSAYISKLKYICELEELVSVWGPVLRGKIENGIPFKIAICLLFK